jgi:hypothetical protein
MAYSILERWASGCAFVKGVECRTYGARDHLIDTQPFRAGLRLAAGPPGLAADSTTKQSCMA